MMNPADVLGRMAQERRRQQAAQGLMLLSLAAALAVGAAFDSLRAFGFALAAVLVLWALPMIARPRGSDPKQTPKRNERKVDDVP